MNTDKLRELLTGPDFWAFHEAGGSYDQINYLRVVVSGGEDLDALARLRDSIFACANSKATNSKSRAAARRIMDAWPLDA